MCRWMSYSGATVPLEVLLLHPQHNLIDQSLSSRSPETPTNGDGFGVGWYNYRKTPGLFRSIRPAWNDFNLRDLAAHIDTRLFFAHVRSSSLAKVQETNCHPFRWKSWLFVHNGLIFDFGKVHRDLVLGIAPECFDNLLGTTDSEVIFHLAVTFGLEHDAPRALARTMAFVERTARENGASDAFRGTLGVTDGKTVWAVRYATSHEPPTLYHSRDMDDVYRINPALEGQLDPSTRVLVSEPLGSFPQVWEEVPPSSLVEIRGGELEIRPFSPQP